MTRHLSHALAKSLIIILLAPLEVINCPFPPSLCLFLESKSGIIQTDQVISSDNCRLDRTTVTAQKAVEGQKTAAEAPHREQAEILQQLWGCVVTTQHPLEIDWRDRMKGQT